MGTALLKAANSMLNAIEEMFPASDLHVVFSKKKASQQLNVFLISNGLRGTLEKNSITVWFWNFSCLLHSGRVLWTFKETLVDNWAYNLLRAVGTGVREIEKFVTKRRRAPSFES